MDNREIAAAFEELADRLALTDLKPFRYLAYRTAAATFRDLPVSVAVLAERGDLTSLDGIGAAIAEKVDTLLATGTFPALEDARTQVPDGLLELTRVEGIGGKTAIRIWEAVADEGIAALFAAAEAGTLPAIPGVGPKVQTALALYGAQRRTGTIEARGARSGVPIDAHGAVLPGPWFTRAQARSSALELERLLTEELSVPVQVLHGGDYACGREVVRSARLVLVADPLPERGRLVELLVEHGWMPSPLDDQATIQAVSPSGVPTSVTTALPSVAAATVEARSTPRAWPTHAGSRADPPIALELRERVLDGTLDIASVPPHLVELSDLVGDLHTHSTWSDGSDTILAMATAARDRGDRHLVVTDHSAPYSLVNGLDSDRLLAQAEEIAAANEQLAAEAAAGAAPLLVLQGSEVEILADGSLGLDDAALERLDWVVASIHTAQQQTAEQLLMRMERVLANPLVDQVGHPTSRIILRRDRTALDVERLIELAAAADVVLEINANPKRLDLDSNQAAQAIAAGVRLAINTDAHASAHFDYREHGVSVARRAGASRADVVNCLEWSELARARRRNSTASCR